MGSGGATALGKAYPDKFSTVSCFNNSFRSAVEGTSLKMLGTKADNLPTNLRSKGNSVVRIWDVFSLFMQSSQLRDFPLFRVWVGKNDDNVRMAWGPDVVQNLRASDSLGMGADLQWDERPHTYQTLGFHWIEDLPVTKQTYRDNLNYQETFRSNQSYPAFFNHRLDAQNNVPGQGTLGINNGDGDNWGTWGGYHHWDLNSINDQFNSWAATVWLESEALFANDNCLVNSLTADVAIRKPQHFLPVAGKMLSWTVKDVINGNTLQSGMTTVSADGLVVLSKIVVFRENIRKVRITISDGTVAARDQNAFEASDMHLFPNPSSGTESLIYLSLNSMLKSKATVRAININGNSISLTTQVHAGENQLPLKDFDRLPSGFYLVDVEINGVRRVGKWVKQV